MRKRDLLAILAAAVTTVAVLTGVLELLFVAAALLVLLLGARP